MYVFVYTANIQTYFLKNKLLFIINVSFMEISKSDEKFTPTVDWITEKYFELNEWLFNGRLGNCLFEIYTTGEGMETSLGHFRFTGRGVKYNKRTRQMYYTDYGQEKKIDADNFVYYAKPMIGLNGNYKRTEYMWLNTLAHEMCHYYTYMGGRRPVQAHGIDFRQIASIVGIRSNGIFNIKRICDAENVGELDEKIAARRQKREENKKSKMTALLAFRTNGDVQLITTTNQKLIDVVIANNNKPVCKRILATNDKSYIEYLWGEGYKHNMSPSKSGTNYKYWSVQGEDLVDEIKNYDFTVLRGEPMNETYQFTNEDIKLMVEMVLDKLKGEDNLIDITPDMILSDDFGLEQ